MYDYVQCYHVLENTIIKPEEHIRILHQRDLIIEVKNKIHTIPATKFQETVLLYSNLMYDYRDDYPSMLTSRLSRVKYETYTVFLIRKAK